MLTTEQTDTRTTARLLEAAHTIGFRPLDNDPGHHLHYVGGDHTPGNTYHLSVLDEVVLQTQSINGKIRHSITDIKDFRDLDYKTTRAWLTGNLDAFKAAK